MARSVNNTDFPAADACGGFRTLTRPGFKGYCAEYLDGETTEKLLAFDHLLAAARIVKDSRGTTAGIAEVDGAKVFVKNYNAYNLKRKLRWLLDTPRPQRVLEATRAISALGIPVPELLCGASWKTGVLARRHAVVFAAYPDPLTAAEQIAFITEPAVFTRFFDELAAMMALIHRNSICHGDLKLHNILLRQLRDGGFKLGLFDFDGVKFGKLSERARAKELARVLSSFNTLCRQSAISCREELAREALIGAYMRESGVAVASAALDRELAKYATHKPRY